MGESHCKHAKQQPHLIDEHVERIYSSQYLSHTPLHACSHAGKLLVPINSDHGCGTEYARFSGSSVNQDVPWLFKVDASDDPNRSTLAVGVLSGRIQFPPKKLKGPGSIIM